MKKNLTVLLIVLIAGLTANAKTYYFAANGNDANSGTSTSSPFKSLNKFNSIFSSLSPGDYVLFNRGDVFYGTLNITKSGSSGSPITIGAYGSGANPVITGFTSVSSWTNLGSNIWESSSSVSSLSGCNMVLINGSQVAMGRYPNSGYLTYQSASGNSSITSSSLNSSSTNWTGAEAVIRKSDWVLDRCIIKSHSGTTINYSDAYTSDAAIANFGFFIQNDSRTLDQQNEWYYNSSTKKIRIYSTSAPSNVQVSTVSNLLYSNGYDYITIDNLAFTGSSDNAISLAGGSADYFTIQNSTINFCGQHGIAISNGKGCVIDNNTISNCNMAGIESSSGSGISITKNTISNIGIIPGQGNYSTHSDGIYAASSGIVIKYNTIQNVSYNGIFLSYLAGNSIAQYNFIVGTNAVLDDGGGIYAAGYGTAGTRTIDHNIVLNTLGNKAGSKSTTVTAAGIYLDEPSSNITVTNNTVANGLNAGIKMHKAKDNIVNNNTSFNNAVWQIYFQNATSTPLISGNTMNGNIFFSKASTQWVLGFVTLANDIANFGNADNNYYVRPIDNNVIFNTYQSNTDYVNRTFASWKSFTGKDANSKATPKTITNVNDIRFEYNATTSNKTISLDGNYIDAKNVSYNGSITLAPYTSAVLIRNGAATGGNQSPTANAGSNQTITLPTNTAQLTGSGTDPDGSITAYNWTKISGPSAGVIGNANTAVTNVTGLTQGTYVFQLKVTDNAGATASSSVQITVNSSTSGTNQSPTANAGSNQTITLPTNVALLSGSGSDPDGIITSYNWTKISGPSSGYFSNPNTMVTNVNSLTQGTYIYQLKVTDNGGATATSTVQVTVNAVGTITNQLPTANAGSNQTITLPTNVALLSGSGSDPDGRITAINWTKISGPSSGYFSNASTWATNVNGLTQGTYLYQLKVTDNGGATATSTVQVTVNPVGTITSSNQLPTANAGSSQTITLPTNFTLLSGSGKDPDGRITAYNWTKISGPSTGYFSNANTAATNVNGLTQGTYLFQLKVTDNGGATATSTVQVTVNKSSATSMTYNNNSISISANNPAALELGIKAYPNPFTSYIEVNINSANAGEFRLDLVDAAGKIVWTQKGNKAAGSFQQSINTSNLLRGIYFLKMVQDNTSSVIKLVK